MDDEERFTEFHEQAAPDDEYLVGEEDYLES